MATMVEVAPEVKHWIITKAKFDSINSTLREKVDAWIGGNNNLTFKQVEALSRATNIPLGYFFLKTPPNEEIPLLEYRTVDSIELENPSRELIDTIQDMQNIQDWMHDYLTEEDYDPLMFVGSCQDTSNINNIALQIRTELNLKSDWCISSNGREDAFKTIRRNTENSGIIVMMNGIAGSNTHRSLNINEFRAFTLIDEYAPLIFINANDSQSGKLFSLLHEVAHIWLGADSFFNDRGVRQNNVNKIETICNAVAAELIIPRELFLKSWAQCAKEEDKKKKISQLASKTKCGITVIARMALDNGFIDKPLYAMIAQEAIDFYNEQRQRKKTLESKGDYYKTMATRIDSRFLVALANSAYEGKTLYTDAFRLTHTNRKTFDELVRKVGGNTV